MRTFTHALAVLAVLVVAAPASAAVPRGFFGAMLDGPAIEPSFTREQLARELDLMRASGVGTVRVVWSWAQTQPYASHAAVPGAERARFRDVGGLPLDVERIDRLVALAAERGLRVLPVAVDTPSWIVRRLLVPASPPRAVAPYAAYLRALVGRYGSRGAFWREHPELPRIPVRWWQLWNEPHLREYWNDRRWTEDYARLARAGARAIHAADRSARVVLAGMTSDLRAVWDRLDEALAEGLGSEVDMIAAHVFTRRPADVVRALRRVRATMRAYGLERMPLALTEWSFPSSRGLRPGRVAPWETTPRRQAELVASTLRRLVRARRSLNLATAVHYTWVSDERGPEEWEWAGLRRSTPGGGIVSKPALAALRAVALEARR